MMKTCPPFHLFSAFSVGESVLHSTYTGGSFKYRSDTMSVNGIWKVEMLTTYDWEARATAFLRDGNYWGAGAQHYAVGNYKVDGTKFLADIVIVNHGEPRTLFGRKVDRYEIAIEAEISGDVFTGVGKDKEGNHVIQYKVTRLADLP